MSNMRHIRKNVLRITQKELSSWCQVDQGTVSRWEAGTLEPRLSDLKNIVQNAAANGVTLPCSAFFSDPAPVCSLPVAVQLPGALSA